MISVICRLTAFFVSAPLFAQTPIVHISLPKEEMFLRANVPIFGSVRMPIGSGHLFKSWKLEYGAGVDPKTWTLLRASDKLLEYDPWNNGDIIWNPNKEPEGNLGNWGVGLQSYTYARWRQNLNGIYTLRLTAETKTGAKAETRRLVYVGEAIMRTVGGTALSSDQRCRFSIPPFAFEGFFARVVTIIRQAAPPPWQLADLQDTEDTRGPARAIYKSIPKSLQLRSAIYRIYPNGLITEPAGELAIDFDQKAMVPPLEEIDRSATSIRQFNPVFRTWDAIATQWTGNTAHGTLPQVSPYESYVALFQRSGPTEIRNLRWEAQTVLEGTWVGDGEAGAKVVVSDGQREASAICDARGKFAVPFRLQPKSTEYRFISTPPEGERFAARTQLRKAPTGAVILNKPLLTFIPRTSQRGDFLLVSCEDPSLAASGSSFRRSALVTLSGAERSGEATFELTEAVPGSGLFTGEIFDRDLVSDTGRPLDQPFSLRAGISTVPAISLPDYHPPRVKLESRTHPAFFFATPQDADALVSFRSHSQSQVSLKEGSWVISSTNEQPSARMTRWNLSGFPVSSWPIIGFTYKLYEKSSWQLFLRSGTRLNAFYFNNEKSTYPRNIPLYSTASPLLADGKWHFWQGNLQSGRFKNIAEVAFGSWQQTAYYRIDPGFGSRDGDTLQLKSLFVGSSYASPLVEMNWRVEDRSRIRKVTWWVDQTIDAKAPEQFGEDSIHGILDNPPETGKCQFRLPENGRWFFHLIAQDAAGNFSHTATFPLFIHGLTPTAVAETPPADEKAPSTAENPPEMTAPTETVSWTQPDGKLTLHLKGFGAALNPRSLALVMWGHRFPITAPVWDAVNETLTVSSESFKAGTPLGFHDEVVPVEVDATDLSGKPVPGLPVFQVKFQSALAWNPSENGGQIQFRELRTESWLAGWKNPSPPWSGYFPGSVNNLLSVISLNKNALRRIVPIRWLRPIQIQKSGEEPIYELEGLNSPESEEVKLDRNAKFPVFDRKGNFLTDCVSSPSGKWICRLTGADPFEEGVARVITRTASQIHLASLNPAELKKRLDLQREETIRLDVWLPPDEGFLSLKAPGRKISYSWAGDDLWTRAPSAEITLKADSGWKRAAILLSAKSGEPLPKGTEIRGNYYW